MTRKQRSNERELSTLTFRRASDLNGAFTVYDILKTSLNGTHDLSACDTPRLDSAPDPQDLWLFTDPAAREVYRQQNRLDQLRDDIAAYAMHEGRWTPQELELKQGFQRLLSDSFLVPKNTFCHLSPHPTVYRAVSEGQLEVTGQRFHFGAGDDLVFVPWLARVSYPGLNRPVHIGRLQHLTTLCLCSEAFPVVGNLCERALAILHETLPKSMAQQLERHRH